LTSTRRSLRDGGCAGDHAHSLRAPAAAAAGYCCSGSSAVAAMGGGRNHSVHWRYCCRLLEAAGAFGTAD